MADPKQIYTYIIAEKDTGRFKVGKSRNPTARMAALQTSNAGELEIIAVYKGDCELELQFRLRDFHVRGEWFNDEEGAVIEFLRIWRTLTSDQKQDFLRRARADTPDARGGEMNNG